MTTSRSRHYNKTYMEEDGDPDTLDRDGDGGRLQILYRGRWSQ